MVALIGLAWAFEGVDPFWVVRVEDPDHPDALVRSDAGSVLAGPPASGPWRWEPVAELDSTPAFEAISATNADVWHANGHRGQGVRVAVFDPGFADADPAEIGPYSTHDCVAHRSCELDFDPLRADGGTHGATCAEVVHDMAPDAEIFLVRTTSFTSFENAARWCIRNGIDIISMSVSFYNDSFVDGTGPFAPLLRELEEAGVLLVTSAGNNARQHWSGPFVDADGDLHLDFDGSNGLLFEVPGGIDRRLNVIWNQYRACGTTDLDVVVYNADGAVVGRSAELQEPGADGCQPVERVRFDAPLGGVYRLEVGITAGSMLDLEVDVLTRTGSVLNASPRHSVTVPADHPLAYAVGSVRADQYLTAPTEGFSSWGPNHAGWPKPDVVGPNRLSTSVSGAEGFSGTSASTPAVAGLIAVVMSSQPGLSARDAAEIVREHAHSDQPRFGLPDPAFGAGRARLPADLTDGGCGRRPLILPLFLLPVGWRRVRWSR
jgi:subtilisin family serine protease